MDYEKLHKDTIAKLQEMVNSGKITVKTACGICADFAPESEDERIRKDLIIYLRSILSNKKYGDKFIESWIAWLEKQVEQKLNPVLDIEIPFGANDSELQEASYYIPEGFHAEIEGNRVVIKRGEQKPADFSDLRTWKYIVDAVWTEKEGIGQYLDSPFTEEVAKKLQKRFGKIEQKPAETEKGVKENFREIPFSEQK